MLSLSPLYEVMSTFLDTGNHIFQIYQKFLVILQINLPLLQKAFDRMEWGWLNYVMECFNFGLTFREWVYMLFKKGKTCIKTNGFISKFFPISRSARQGYK
jgi:hypothetical protein